MVVRRLLHLLVTLSLVASVTFPLTAAAQVDERPIEVVRGGDDVEVPVADPSDALAPQATDPLGLLVGIDTIRDHSLGTDRLDVWACGVSESARTLAGQLQSRLGPWPPAE